jgi:hypothetical protein
MRVWALTHTWSQKIWTYALTYIHAYMPSPERETKYDQATLTALAQISSIYMHTYLHARTQLNISTHSCIYIHTYIRLENQKRPGITNSVATHLFSDNIVTAAPGFNAGMGRHIRAQQYSDWHRNWQSVRTRNEKGETIHVGWERSISRPEDIHILNFCLCMESAPLAK